MSEKNIDLNDMTHMFDHWNPTPEELKEFTEKLSKWAISKGGEYIKKEDILNELGDTNMDILTDEVKEIVNSLPSYSFPDSPEPEADGTLVVHTKDGSKVSRVLVLGDNIFGGLYYPDSDETETAKPEEGAELIDRRQIKWYGCDHEGHIKGINCDTADCSKCFFATVEHDEVMSLPVYRIPDSAEIKKARDTLLRLRKQIGYIRNKDIEDAFAGLIKEVKK